MRINIYAEEMTERIEIISKSIDGREYTGLRLYLYLPVTTGDGNHLKGPFLHRPGDDDSAAITFWGKRDLRKVLSKALGLLNAHYGDTPGESYEMAELRAINRDLLARIARADQLLLNASRALEPLTRPAPEIADAARHTARVAREATREQINDYLTGHDDQHILIRVTPNEMQDIFRAVSCYIGDYDGAPELSERIERMADVRKKLMELMR